ncbi:SCO6745 family protein [Cumulibacter soli]|uniref:SCO6745 family protein n=1 Tax=Cumulibacter soli TaxID=2546344 RepID=UPI001067BCC8|nr:hypothetical protein [Cumulibacter soli]
MTLRHNERARGYARQAYQALEPLHIVAYFGPQVGEVSKAEGLNFYGSYVGFRGAPLGACSPAVVAAAFYNWNPAVIEKGWQDALASHTPAQLLAARERIADKALTGAFGDLLGSDQLPRVVDRLNGILSNATKAGRALGAANLDVARHSEPHVALWQATATWREWRGDGHIGALIANELPPVEALVLHTAEHPDPSVGGGALSKDATKSSRAWGDEAWEAAADRLRTRGLLEADAERLTTAGAQLYDLIEDQTDDAAASIWANVDDADEFFAAVRPFVKSVIDAGILPGTKKK